MDRLEVPLPKSLCSRTQTEYPREAASTAMPMPVAPPPMTAMSQGPLRASKRLIDVSRSIDRTFTPRTRYQVMASEDPHGEYQRRQNLALRSTAPPGFCQPNFHVHQFKLDFLLCDNENPER